MTSTHQLRRAPLLCDECGHDHPDGVCRHRARRFWGKRCGCTMAWYICGTCGHVHLDKCDCGCNHGWLRGEWIRWT
ncbi:hypothetical protein [Gordonia sp. (in: high G+C Gram-positive bacteria)]|uniref:hypothetical protein n=1 Tax=Gordonia sp. (in: high G+C Gram-positive bacteria) TaxID=84139 RepID=UPI00334274E5